MLDFLSFITDLLSTLDINEGISIVLLCFILLCYLFYLIRSVRKECSERKHLMRKNNRLQKYYKVDKEEGRESSKRERDTEINENNSAEQDIQRIVECQEKIEKINLSLRKKYGIMLICLAGLIILSAIGIGDYKSGRISVNNTRELFPGISVIESEPESETQLIIDKPELTQQTEDKKTVVAFDNNDDVLKDEKYYDTRCRMKLQDTSENLQLNEEELNRVFFGLLDWEPSKLLSEQAYRNLERSLMGSIGLSKENSLMMADYDFQREVLSITVENDAFWEEVEDKRLNPPARKGTQMWYNLLPSTDRLLVIIESQEKFLNECPDYQLALQLYVNYKLLADEYKLQGNDDDKAVYYYEKAALCLQIALEFENYTMDNSLDILIDLKNIYSELSRYRELISKDIEIECAGIIVNLIDRLIDDNIGMNERDKVLP